LPDANGAAAWVAGCVPHREPGGKTVDVAGYDAARLVGALSGYVLYGLEPALDYARPDALHQALDNADFVLSLSSFRSAVPLQATVALPLAPFTENSGSYINVEGRVQFSNAAVAPQGEARPGWKILRVLANLMALEGFDYISVDEITREVPLPGKLLSCRYSGVFPGPRKNSVESSRDPKQESLERVFDVPLYAVDPVVRRATSLQKTQDNPESAVHIHPSKMMELGLTEGILVDAHGIDGVVRLPVQSDDRVPDGCVYIPTARLETAALGASEFVWLKKEQ
jgi:NADH-quinone oxidoreductase subunit G